MKKKRPAPRKRAARAAGSAGGRRDRASIGRARRGLDVATRALSARAAALAAVADRIGATAVEAEREKLATELAAERILRDVLELRAALSAAPAGSLPPSLEVLRKLPDALIDWLQRRLGLASYLETGEELEVPVDRLSRFDLDGATSAPRGLVRLRVIAPGWRRGPRVLVRPQAVVVSG